MSRGLGRVERGVLEHRAGCPSATTRQTAEHVYGAPATESQMRAVRRSVARLVEKGLLGGPSEPVSEPPEHGLIRAEIDRLAATGEEFDADTVRRRFAGDDEDSRTVRRALYYRPRLIGALIGGAARRGVISRVGMVRSGRSSRKSGRGMLWTG
ncbi:hypothetical protein MTQ12_13570 [Brevibacterium sp. R8603A2]|uniref:hypothetical protein n=1 Tax=Brevibacterium sp. R8603A2 TaxID=2929779 RepID=UPI001FF78AED|nr:hypothetical protein [Brevibacterium sp. R8603A2]MCK1804065.1 hypothetical protein [Brevibacterium sp. R8603A2]